MLKIYLLIWGVLISLFSQAQKISDLEFWGRPYYLTSDGSLKDLERSEISVTAKIKGGGWKDTDTYLKAAGDKSSMRIDSNSIMKFYIKFTIHSDPSESLKIVRGEALKGSRQFLYSRTSRRGERRIIPNDIKLKFKKLSEGFFEISVDGKLESGEYFFMPVTESGLPCPASQIHMISCFGVK